MSEEKNITPWAYVAHKNGQLAGVAVATMPKNDLGKFLGAFAADGFAITTVYSRAEYETMLKLLRREKKNRRSSAVRGILAE